jgi:putative aldouronate transport system permease protein
MKVFKRNGPEFVFDGFLVIVFAVLCLSMIYPFIYLLSMSLSGSDVTFAQVQLIPQKLSLINFSRVLSSEYILSGMFNSVARTLLGTFLSLLVTVCMAYTLSKKYFPHRTFWTGIAVFTMFFDGGLIPVYMLVKGLGFINTIWALVLPELVWTFIMIIVRNYFMTLPESLEESAKIDGANDIRILFSIVLPVSLPIIMTLILWIAVDQWNAWFDSMIYINDPKKQVLMVIMRRVVLEGSAQLMDLNSSKRDSQITNPDSVKAATIILTVLPIILVYPFLQKYLIKGMLVGSIKG